VKDKKTKLLSALMMVLMLIQLLSCASSKSEVGGTTVASKAYQEHNLMGTLWAKYSGEWRALSYQAYNVAREQLDHLLKKYPANKIAIVADLDETVLDNVEYQVRNIKNDRSYDPATWAAWVAEANAKTMPGALGFFNYAKQKGVKYFFLSNRKVGEGADTVKNLQTLGFKFEADQMLLREKDRSKQPRRDSVAKNYSKIMYLGDNLSDFSVIFDDKKMPERKAAVDQVEKKFGNEYIVLPNPMYGDWEGALYDFNMKMSDKEKAQMRFKLLDGEN